jgi:hypothetical protein
MATTSVDAGLGEGEDIVMVAKILIRTTTALVLYMLEGLGGETQEETLEDMLEDMPGDTLEGTPTAFNFQAVQAGTMRTPGEPGPLKRKALTIPSGDSRSAPITSATRPFPPDD